MITSTPTSASASLTATQASTPVIELDGLEVNLGGRPILQGLTAKLSGRSIGLLGPNGAGKTTLLHTLLGFYPPSAGTARVLGCDIRTEGRKIRSLMGYMPENDAFVSGMSGVRLVRLMAELSGLPPSAALERAHEALFYVGLGEARYRPVDSYSLGMKQLAKLAQSLAHGPKVLFLDEPTNGLDPPARERMIRLIRDLRDAGEVRVILSSHLLRDVEECCEEVLVLKAGKIATYCNLEEERKANRRFLELELRGPNGVSGSIGTTVEGEVSTGSNGNVSGIEGEFAAALTALGCECAESSRRRLKVVLPPEVGVADLYRVAEERQIQIRHLDYKRDSLEDIFLKAMES